MQRTPNRLSKRGWLQGGSAMLLAVSLLLQGASQPVFAVGCGVPHCYAGSRPGTTTTTVSGIDGYIWGTTVLLSDPLRNFQAHFINLCPASLCSTGWAQIGPFQGTINANADGTCPPVTCVRSQAAMRMYGENTDACSNYVITDFGAPPNQNEPYYLSYSGTSQFIDCATQYKFYFRYGSLTNPPAGSAWFGKSTGYTYAETEIYGGETTNTDYFGLDGSHNVNDSFGVHALKSGSWVLWDSTSIPGSTSYNNTPPYDVIKKAYSAFQTHS